VTLPDVDYHHEKYAIVALGHYLVDVESWSSVLVGVAPGSLDSPAGLRGKPLPVIDAELDKADSRFWNNFHTDTGGIDLVATKPGRTLLVEAKRISIAAPLGIEQLVGRTVLSMRSDRPDRSYAILIPDLPQWLQVVGMARNPMLSEIGVYAVGSAGGHSPV
jgi:hypothetical protein